MAAPTAARTAGPAGAGTVGCPSSAGPLTRDPHPSNDPPHRCLPRRPRTGTDASRGAVGGRISAGRRVGARLTRGRGALSCPTFDSFSPVPHAPRPPPHAHAGGGQPGAAGRLPRPGAGAGRARPAQRCGSRPSGPSPYGWRRRRIPPDQPGLAGMVGRSRRGRSLPAPDPKPQPHPQSWCRGSVAAGACSSARGPAGSAGPVGARCGRDTAAMAPPAPDEKAGEQAQRQAERGGERPDERRQHQPHRGRAEGGNPLR